MNVPAPRPAAVIPSPARIVGAGEADQRLTRRQELSVRELDVMAALVRWPDATYPDIARRLGISRWTLNNHRSAIFGKLGVANMRGAFVALGWLRAPDS